MASIVIDTGSYYAPYIPEKFKITFKVSDMYSTKWKKRVEFMVFPAAMIEWLTDTFGHGTDHRYWTNYENTIYFSDEEDLTLFMLRWA